MKKTFKAWAIDLNEEPYGFAGRYFHFTNWKDFIPLEVRGCLTCLFETRQVARDHLAAYKSSKNPQFNKAKVVRVQVAISEIQSNKKKRKN